ncbi:MAG: EamA/RhaT family transporter [Cryomorphaceae bacterium]|nr:EamA/RhaT family transporter [Flavobacteriales bacterium]
MIYLLLSVLSSTAIYAVFKVFKKVGINNFQAIVANYFVASGLGFVVAFSNTSEVPDVTPWLPYAGAVGVLFITLFYVMALTSQKNGVSATSIATKMSMVIPAAFFIATDPDEGLTVYKVLGITLGIVAVILASLKGKNSEVIKNSWVLPVVLFIGSGILDLILAFVEKTHLTTPGGHEFFVPVPFGLAALLGAVALVFAVATGKHKIQGKSFLGGIVLGVVNYGSIYFLLKFLGSGILDRSSVIPINNMGVVAISTLVGFLAFREQLTAKNIIGILLSFIAIGLLSWQMI